MYHDEKTILNKKRRIKVKKIMVVLLILLMHGQVYASTGQDFFVSLEEERTALYLYPVIESNTFGNKVLVDNNVEIEKVIGDGAAVWIEVADFNSDGQSDIILMRSFDEASIYYQNAEMEFSKTTITLDNTLAPKGGYKPVAGDFNNDGQQDFAYIAFNNSGSADESIVIVLNQGGGNFTFQKYEKPGYSTRYSIDSGDFNGDGNLDLLGQGYESGQVYLHAGNGDGSFKTPIVVFDNPSPIMLAAAKPVVADFNDDGKLDFIVGGDDDGDPGQAYLFLGDGDGNFTDAGEVYDSKPFVESGSDDWSHYSNNAYDFDGDGDTDVLLLLNTWSGNAPGSDGDLLFMENQGGGVFDGPTAMDGITDLVAFVGPGSSQGTYQTVKVLIGDKDSFHPGDKFDIPTQSQLVREIIASRAPEDKDVPLDVGGGNRPVGLTFYFGIPQNAQLVGAQVEFKFQGTNNLVRTDGILYESPGYPVITLRDLYGSYDDIPSINTPATKIIDLSHVPVRTSGDHDFYGDPDEYRNLLPELLDGQFDMVFLDDMTIDYAELTLIYAFSEEIFSKEVPVKTTGKIKTYNWQ
ncbi:MAG: VCBS repeat-containing protein, partial [Candidatus Electrothrix sp. AR1]|nr:VCBS repeat-containing protein [Candidatus Electrothrix sp. AR1]